MKRLRNHLIGVDQGSETLFSDFEHNGPMWTGDGPREARHPMLFSEQFREAPSVMVGFSMWDTSAEMNQRADIRAENVTIDGFDMVFRTWADSRVARVRADWIAIGELRHADDWELY
jgi:hypothetical protein